MKGSFNIKKQLHSKCIEISVQHSSKLKNIIKEAQLAANNETKSSAGDKHETGRAMAQLETEKLSKQLAEALKLEETLSQINPAQKHLKIGLGSLVITNNGTFYIAVSLRKIELNNTVYFAISAAAPISKRLIGLEEGDEFSFNDKKYRVKEIY